MQALAARSGRVTGLGRSPGPEDIIRAGRRALEVGRGRPGCRPVASAAAEDPGSAKPASGDSLNAGGERGAGKGGPSPPPPPGTLIDAAALERSWKWLSGATPRSLEHARGAQALPPETQASGLRRLLLRLGGYYSEESAAGRGGRALYAAACEAVDDPRARAALGLPDPTTFTHKHSLLALHVWLLQRRVRDEGEAGRALAQALHDQYQDDVEMRVRAAGVKVRLQKHLTDLEKQFYGCARAYDTALGADQAPGALAEALRRNVFMGELGQARSASRAAAAGPSSSPSQQPSPGRDRASVLARYATLELACLARTRSEAIFAGDVKFSTGLYE